MLRILSLVLVFVVGSSAALCNADEKGADNWRDINRCGPNSVYVLLRMFGFDCDYDQMVASMKIDHRGASAASLIRAAGEFGLDLTPLRIEAEKVSSYPMPCIAHLQPPGENGHFVILLHAPGDENYSVFECTGGKIEQLNKGDFLNEFSGVLLVRTQDWRQKQLDQMILVIAISSSLVLFILLIATIRRKHPSGWISTSTNWFRRLGGTPMAREYRT